MHLYHFTNRFPGEDTGEDDLPEGTKSLYAGTRDQAKDFIKTVLPTERAGFFVELVEVPTNKEGVLGLLHGNRSFSVLKRWKFTNRGALRECDDQGHFKQTAEEA
jgi:hypothetical protein